VTTYCIPSYRRPQVCAVRTVALLARLGVTAPEVWLSDPWEAEAYAAVLPAGARVRDGEPGLPANRAAAMHAHHGERVVFLDDDIADLLVLAPGGESLRPAEAADLARLTEAGFGACRQWGLRMWGISPVANAFYMGSRVTAGRYFCIGGLYGLDLPPDPGPYVTVHAEKEDYERSLRAAEADGGTVRVSWAAFRSPIYKGQGGLNADRTIAAQEAVVAYLEQRFPGQVTRNTRRASGYPEIKIVPRRLR
jgi:hypothetical protein